MNKKSKKLIVALIIAIAVFMDLVVIANSVKAVNINEISQVDLHFGGICPPLLKYKGIIVKTTYVEYYGSEGINYPAYCMDKDLPGVTDKQEYTVTTNNRINDLGLWRTVINGYPYKSLAELGVADIDEAFTATKHAVYCYLFENTPDDYEAIGEAGERTLNALKKIVSDAENSNENIGEGIFEVKKESEKWEEDEIDSNFISKTYSLKSNVDYTKYEVAFEGEVPEGSKITKIDGPENSLFSGQEQFKIMLPKDKLESEGDINLSIKTELKTKPVLYGESPDSSWQNYAVTAYMFEDATTSFKDTYPRVKKPEKPEKPDAPETPSTPETPKKEEVKILPVTGM